VFVCVCLCVYVCVCGKQAGRHPHIYIHTQAHRHTGTQIHRHTGTQTHRHTGTQAPKALCTADIQAHWQATIRARSRTHIPFFFNRVVGLLLANSCALNLGAALFPILTLPSVMTTVWAMAFLIRSSETCHVGCAPLIALCTRAAPKAGFVSCWRKDGGGH